MYFVFGCGSTCWSEYIDFERKISDCLLIVVLWSVALPLRLPRKLCWKLADDIRSVMHNQCVSMMSQLPATSATVVRYE